MEHLLQLLDCSKKKSAQRRTVVGVNDTAPDGDRVVSHNATVLSVCQKDMTDSTMLRKNYMPAQVRLGIPRWDKPQEESVAIGWSPAVTSLL